VLGRLLFRAHDRLDPSFADVPPDDDLPLRESLQVRPGLQVQGRLNGGSPAAYCASAPGGSPDSGQYASANSERRHPCITIPVFSPLPVVSV